MTEEEFQVIAQFEARIQRDAEALDTVEELLARCRECVHLETDLERANIAVALELTTLNKRFNERRSLLGDLKRYREYHEEEIRRRWLYERGAEELAILIAETAEPEPPPIQW